MPFTLIAGIVEPRNFRQYIAEQTAARSALFTSGIVQQTPEFDELAALPGLTVDMPFWQDLAGDDEVLQADGTALTPVAFTTASDKAVFQERGKSFGAHDLAGVRAGSDPLRALGDRFANYWALRYQQSVISTLAGVFGAASMSANRHNIALGIAGTPLAANTLTGTTMLDAAQKLGENSSRLVAVVMHSAVQTYLAKLNQISFIQPSVNEPVISFFQGKRVIISDALTPATVNGNLEYKTYLFGEGAFAYGESIADRPAPGAPPGSDWYFELSREGLAGTSAVIVRRRRILHPRGVAWQGVSVTGTGNTPTNANLATQSNWVRVYEPQNVRIVEVLHNIL